VGQATAKSHTVVEADIFFEKEENTKQYNKYLQLYISAAYKMRTVTLSS
jgi:hypothetical protein